MNVKGKIMKVILNVGGRKTFILLLRPTFIMIDDACEDISNKG